MTAINYQLKSLNGFIYTFKKTVETCLYPEFQMTNKNNKYREK